ncbi:MAG: response regulator [Desulfocapsa sp.]|nr:response regulator [Desulfocapsa sp.]
MKKVLIVDDDKSFLQSLIDGFKAYEDKFSIITAGDGIEAVQALKKEEVSLVLTDLKMPRMDGFELVAHLSSNYSDTPVIVMTAFGTPEMEESLRAMGTIQYIEKPIDFAVLVEKILKGLKGPSHDQGYITGVSLSSFLQLLEIDKKTCTLTIRSGNKKGYMHFNDGDLLDANYKELQGSEAAFEVVSWKNVEIAMDSSCSIKEKNISESLGFILLEGSRRTDENDAAGEFSSSGSDDEPFGDLDSLNMENLDLNLADENGLQSPAASGVASKAPELSEAVAANPVLSQFVMMLSSFPEIENATVSAKDGTTLHQEGNPDSSIANFITYVAVAVEQIQTTIGASDKQHTIFTMSDGSKLIVLCGPEVIVGLTVGSSVFPVPIADGLRPVLRRITL